MKFKFLRLFYHYYQTPATMNPFVAAPAPGHRRPRSEGLPVVDIVDADDDAAVEAVARVLRASAGDAASTCAQFAVAVAAAAPADRGAESQRRLGALQRAFVRDVRAMGFDGWLYQATMRDGSHSHSGGGGGGGGGGTVVVGGAFLERVDAGWRHASSRGACRAFWVVRRPDDAVPGRGRARGDDVWLGHMRDMHGRLYALVDRLARQQVFVLTAIGVREQHRNQGIGTQLLRHIETHIGENNVIVVVSERYCQGFFAKNGFEVAEEPGLDPRNGNQTPTTLMLKNHEAPLAQRRGH